MLELPLTINTLQKQQVGQSQASGILMLSNLMQSSFKQALVKLQRGTKPLMSILRINAILLRCAVI